MFPLNWDFPFRKKNGEMTTLLDSVAGGLTVSDIANNLTTTTDGKVLDARQGKALNDSKLNKSDIANNLTTTTEGKALDARQGKALSDAITTLGTNTATALNGKINTDDIANNLNTTAGGKVLDARQGKALNDAIVNIFEPSRRLLPTDNMNNIASGVFYQDGGYDYMPENAPSGAYNALIMSFKTSSGNRIIQFWFSVNNHTLYHRTWSTQGWTSWLAIQNVT